MKSIRWTPHAVRNLVEREIDRIEADRTLAEAEFVVPGQPGRQIYMRRYFDPRLQREMLLRLVIEEARDEIVVLMLFKTSQIDKYLRGLLA